MIYGYGYYTRDGTPAATRPLLRPSSVPQQRVRPDFGEEREPEREPDPDPDPEPVTINPRPML